MKTWIGLAMLAASLGMGALPLRSTASDAATGRPATDESTLLMAVSKAVKQGDVPALAQLYRTSADPVAHGLAAMALERIHFNLEKSSEDARICERSLIDSQPRVAFYCARFANGNLRLLAGPKQADAAELGIARRFAGKIPQAEIENLRHYAASQESTPELKVERPASGVVIPVQRSLASGMLPTIEVKSHGAKARLIVDTGSSFITLDPDSAKKLGVHMLNHSGETGGFISRNIPVSYGVLDSLTIGNISVVNAPVAVLAGQKNLIGISLLRHLGSFRLGEKSLTVYGDAQAQPTCREPMLVVSDVWGNRLSMLAALSIDGTLRTTLIDSGSSEFLSGDQKALAQLHTRRNGRMNVRDMGSHRHVTRVSEATADVDISGRAFEITFQVYKDTSLPWHYVLGGGALTHMDFYFDFTGKHTCLLLHDDLH